MIYYAKTSCMIDGHSYNAGEIVPESVIKSSGSLIMHLVRKDGEPNDMVVTPTELSNESTDLANTEDDDDLPVPEQKSDAVVTPPAASTATAADTTGSQSTTTSSTPVSGSKNTEVKKETK